MKSAMSLYAKDNHKRAARALGYALTLGTSGAWLDFAAITAARLTDQERGGLAYAGLRSLNEDTRAVVVEAFRGIGAPIAPLFSPMDDAAHWADLASAEELEAYCLASFTAMPQRRQAAFLEFVQGRRAA